jgi:hypothetical protein
MNSSQTNPPGYSEAVKSTSVPQDQEAPPPYAEVKAWWDTLDEKKKKDLEKLHQTNPANLTVYRTQHNNSVCPARDDFQMRLMEIYFLNSMSSTVISSCLQASQGASYVMGGVVGSVRGGGSSGGGGGGGNDAVGAVIVGAVVAAILAGVIGIGYTLYKVGSACKDMFTGKKISKSFSRIAAAGGGAYIGAIKGAVVGAIVGSMVPVIGTAIGAVVGAICGAGITAGICTFVAKQAPRLINWIFNRNNKKAISTTNPSKYRLTAEREKALADSGVNTVELLTKLRQQKNNDDDCSSYNKLLLKIKKDADVTQPIKIDDLFFSWREKTSKWDKNRAVLQTTLTEPAIPRKKI